MDCFIQQLDLFTNYEQEQESRDISSGRMSQEPLVVIRDMILEQSSKKSVRPKFQCLKITNGQSQDMWNGVVQVRLRGGHSTLNIGECPNAVKESFLSQILQDSPPEKYYLSSRACMGILRRAKERGKTLPPMLEQALMAQCGMATNTAITEGVTQGGFKYRNGAKSRSIGYADEQAPTLETSQNLAIYDLTHHDEVVRQVHGGKTQTLKARAGTGGNNTPIVQCLNDQGGSVMDVSDKAGTLRAENHGYVPIVKAYAFDSLASNAMQSSNPHSGCREVEVSKCLDTTTPDPSKNQGGVAIVGYRAGQYGQYVQDDKAGSARASGGDLGGGSETLISEKSDA